MNKKRLLTAAFISVFLFSVVAGTQLVNFAKGNPYSGFTMPNYVKEGEGSPPAGTLPPTVSIVSPENNTAYASTNISLTFNVSLPKSNNYSLSLAQIYYKTSYQSSYTFVGERVIADLKPLYSLSLSINLTGVPEGHRWLEVYAVGQGRQVTREVCAMFSTIYYLGYGMTGSSIVNFTIDTKPPKVSIPSLENKTYGTSALPLNLITSEPISQSAYSLDGQENVTFAGNTTLTGLANGEHNLIVYAKDEAGNIGYSETIYFSVKESFPTAMVVALIVAVAVIGLGLLVYFKKRKHQAGMVGSN
jgi:hypothetical protein